MPSASAMQASLPDWMMTPRSRSSTRTRLLIGANMLDVRDGAPPVRQALVLIRSSSSSFRRPCLSSLNTTSAVISLDRLAGGTSSSAFRSNSTVPLSASTRIAVGAAVLNSPSRRGVGAAQAAAVRHAIRPATPKASQRPRSRHASCSAALSWRDVVWRRIAAIRRDPPLRLRKLRNTCLPIASLLSKPDSREINAGGAARTRLGLLIEAAAAHQAERGSALRPAPRAPKPHIPA